MTQETFIIFVSIAAVFFAGAAVGQLLLRLQLARLHHINLRLDRRLVSSLGRLAPRHRVLQHHGAHAQDRSGRRDDSLADVRDEIEAMLSEIERS